MNNPAWRKLILLLKEKAFYEWWSLSLPLLRSSEKKMLIDWLILKIRLKSLVSYNRYFLQAYIVFLCFALLCFREIWNFLQIKGLQQPCVKPVYWLHFSNSLCLCHVSVSHFGNCHNISNIFIILYLVWRSMFFDITSPKKIMTHWRLRWWSAFFSNFLFIYLF